MWMSAYKGPAVTPSRVQMLQAPQTKSSCFLLHLFPPLSCLLFGRCSMNHSKLPSEWGVLLSLMTHMPVLAECLPAGTGALLPPLLTHASPEKKKNIQGAVSVDSFSGFKSAFILSGWGFLTWPAGRCLLRPCPEGRRCAWLCGEW